jgi:mono/diheme cytochrome c family protein
MRRVILTMFAVACLCQTALVAQDAKKIADGKKVYSAKECAKCHMIAGKGEQKISPLDGVGSKLTEADIRKWLTSPAEMEAKLDHKPKVKMSSKKIALTDPEVDALVAYMMSLKK